MMQTEFDKLVADYEAWLRLQPDAIAKAHDTSAEALLHEDITPEQRQWLSAFIIQWEAMESRAECARNGHRDSGRGVCVECGEFI